MNIAPAGRNPAERLVAELPGRGCREVLALLDEARRRGRAVQLALLEVNESGVVELVPLRRFSLDAGPETGAR